MWPTQFGQPSATGPVRLTLDLRHVNLYHDFVINVGNRSEHQSDRFHVIPFLPSRPSFCWNALRMTQALIALSQSISRLVASASPLLAAVRVGPKRHVTGLICPGNLILTTDQELPACDAYTVVLSNRLMIAARPGPRDPVSNLAALRLDTPWPAVSPELSIASAGGLVIVLGAEADASPTIRMTVVHRCAETSDGPVAVLDMPADHVGQGSLVLDAAGGLVGLATLGVNGEAMIVPSRAISRMLMPHRTEPAVERHVPAAVPAASSRRGWLGVALQPITVPDQLVVRAGQTSGRMVVSLTKGGPAAMAGMRVGDVLLALNGASASGPQALRGFLGAEQVGTSVEVKLLRDGNMVTTNLTIAPQPD